MLKCGPRLAWKQFVGRHGLCVTGALILLKVLLGSTFHGVFPNHAVVDALDRYFLLHDFTPAALRKGLQVMWHLDRGQGRVQGMEQGSEIGEWAEVEWYRQVQGQGQTSRACAAQRLRCDEQYSMVPALQPTRRCTTV